MALGDLLAKLYNLKRDRGSGWEKPYKPALLLALIDLIECRCSESNKQGHANNNQFALSGDLIRRYRECIAIVRREGDHDKIHYPFWHLCGDEIWMIYDTAGKPLYRPGDNASNSPSVKWMREQIGYAAFDPELFRYLSASTAFSA